MKYRKAMELVRALKSGKYKQAKGRLKDGAAYCCLGVACRVAGKRFTKENGEAFCEGQDMVLPTSVLDYFGFSNNEGYPSDMEPIFVNGCQYGSLASANDCGATFDKIADAIKDNWRRL